MCHPPILGAFYNNEKIYVVNWYWTCYFSIMSKLNHLYNAGKILSVIKCIRNGEIIYWKSVRVYSGIWISKWHFLPNIRSWNGSIQRTLKHRGIQLTSRLTGLDLTKWVKLLLIQHKQSIWTQKINMRSAARRAISALRVRISRKLQLLCFNPFALWIKRLKSWPRIGAAIAQRIRMHLHPAVLGSNPEHTINAFSIYKSILYNICHCLEKKGEKPEIWHIFF